MHTVLSFLMYGVPSILFIIIIVKILSLRKIVPPNMVHILQRGSNTVSYGVGKGSNVYYKFPHWVPKLGVIVRELPVSNFGIDLNSYSAYDKDRVPFEVDVKAFFHISDTNKAAEKVFSQQDLIAQLTAVVQGAVRSILAKSKLEQIMEERSIFGQQFTEAVKDDLKSWGVEPIKSIELMDVRDSKDSKVIHQIMSKRISGIDMESRTEIAKNSKAAQQAELEAVKEVNLTKAETERIAGEAQAASQQAIGIAKAESAKRQGIAQQEAESEIAKSQRDTAAQHMEVIRINQIKQAEIDKDNAIIKQEQNKKQVEIAAEAEKYKIETAAKADKFRVETIAAANLEAKRNEAEAIKAVGQADGEAIKAKGLAEAESEKAKQLAGVVAQTTLAKEIGENGNYQSYLIKIKEIEISGEVNKVQYQSLANALHEADLKVLVNSGDVYSGLGKFSDIISSKGGQALTGLMESLKQTPEGKALLSALDRLNPDPPRLN